MPYIVTSACILCGACVSGCENGAVTEGETQSHIDINICIECGTCERNCPVGAIIFVDDTEAADRSPASFDTADVVRDAPVTKSQR